MLDSFRSDSFTPGSIRIVDPEWFFKEWDLALSIISDPDRIRLWIWIQDAFSNADIRSPNLLLVVLEDVSVHIIKS